MLGHGGFRATRLVAVDELRLSRLVHRGDISGRRGFERFLIAFVGERLNLLRQRFQARFLRAVAQRTPDRLAVVLLC